MNRTKEVKMKKMPTNEPQREIIQLTGKRSVRIKSADWPVIVDEVIPIFRIADPDKNGDLSPQELLQIALEESSRIIPPVTVVELCFSIRRHKDGRAILEMYQPKEFQQVVDDGNSEPFTEDRGPYEKFFLSATLVAPETNITDEIKRLMEVTTRKFGGCRPKDFKVVLSSLVATYKANEVGITPIDWHKAHRYGFSGWRNDYDNEGVLVVVPPGVDQINPLLTFRTSGSKFTRISTNVYQLIDQSSDGAIRIFQNPDGEAWVVGQNIDFKPRSAGMKAYVYDQPFGVFVSNTETHEDQIIGAIQQITKELNLNSASADEMIGKLPPVDLD